MTVNEYHSLAEAKIIPLKYETKHLCPYCNQLHAVIHRYDVCYGSSLRRCQHCEGLFWDIRFAELAIHTGYEANDSFQYFRYLLGFILSFPIGLLMLGAGVFGVYDGDLSFIPLILFGGIMAWLGVKMLITLKKKKDGEEELYIQRREEYDASLLRMQDSAYLEGLAYRDAKAMPLLKQRKAGKEETYAPRP